MASKEIALCFLTCDREEYSERTLKSMQKHIELDRFHLIHADDSSKTTQNRDMVRAAGFDNFYDSDERQGIAAMWRGAVRKAEEAGCKYVLLMENDWEWVRDFSWEAFNFMRLNREIYYMRLFGINKERDGRPCGDSHAAKPEKGKTIWKQIPDDILPGWEVGDIHWGFPPAITVTRRAKQFLKDAKGEKDARMASGKIDSLCMRPKENYVFHIGSERTPGFKQ